MVRAINFTLRLSNSPVYQENSVVQAGVTEQDYPVTPLLFAKRPFPRVSSLHQNITHYFQSPVLDYPPQTPLFIIHTLDAMIDRKLSHPLRIVKMI